MQTNIRISEYETVVRWSWSFCNNIGELSWNKLANHLENINLVPKVDKIWNRQRNPAKFLCVGRDYMFFPRVRMFFTRNKKQIILFLDMKTQYFPTNFTVHLSDQWMLLAQLDHRSGWDVVKLFVRMPPLVLTFQSILHKPVTSFLYLFLKLVQINYIFFDNVRIVSI